MSASPETLIKIELSGTGADPSSMGTTTPSTTTPTSSDTGLFTSSDSLSAGSIIVVSILCALVILGVFAFNSSKQPKMRHVSASKSFNLKKTKGIFKKFGIFLFFLLASGMIIPELLPEDSASALIPTNAVPIELTAGAGGSLTAGATLSGTTGKLAHESETLTCASACDIYISTATTNNSLNYNGDTSKGWIGPKSGTKSALTTNTWGYATSVSGEPSATSAIWSVIPAKGSEAKITSKLEANKNFVITFGAYANNTIPDGTYSNTVVYTAVKSV